jgi:poly [ADP-ribose] polymerase
MADENLKVAKLIFVAVNENAAKGTAKQSNKFYNMTEKGDGTFVAEWGRVDSTSSKKVYPMSKWNTTLNQKTRKGYKDVTHLFKEITESAGADTPEDIAAIENAVIRKLVEELQSYANNTVKQNYKVSSKAVTQAMVDEAQAIVDRLVGMLHTGTKKEDINNALLELYHVIPRKMGNVNDHLMDEDLTSDEALKRARKLVDNEQETLDTMAGQVLLNTEVKEAEEEEKVTKKQKNILEVMGLEMSEPSQKEIDMVKKMMGPNSGQFKRLYKVKNVQTDRKFKTALANVDNKKTELFWHGSRNQNWFNIIATGLLIRPSNAIHTGSMFGDGIYFADKAQKSIGYTSYRGSYWARGNDTKAYLALFRTHVGEQKHIKRHDSSCYSLNHSKIKAEGFDSVFAHGGADLRNNEYIVYQSQQCTVEYLVEIG